MSSTLTVTPIPSTVSGTPSSVESASVRSLAGRLEDLLGDEKWTLATEQNDAATRVEAIDTIQEMRAYTYDRSAGSCPADDPKLQDLLTSARATAYQIVGDYGKNAINSVVTNLGRRASSLLSFSSKSSTKPAAEARTEHWMNAYREPLRNYQREFETYYDANPPIEGSEPSPPAGFLTEKLVDCLPLTTHRCITTLACIQPTTSWTPFYAPRCDNTPFSSPLMSDSLSFSSDSSMALLVVALKTSTKPQTVNTCHFVKVLTTDLSRTLFEAAPKVVLGVLQQTQSHWCKFYEKTNEAKVRHLYSISVETGLIATIQ